MSLTRRNIVKLATAGAAAGLLPAATFAQGTKKTLTLGLSAPITGNQAQYGEDIKRGAELAIAELNAKNTVPDISFQLAVEDSKGDPQEAANVAQKFAARGDITAVIGDFSSTASLAAAPIYQRAGIIMITPTASHPDITKTGNFIFRNTPIAATEADATTDWGTKDLGFKKIAIVGRNDDYGRVYGELFKKRAVANGATVVGEDYINAETPDLKPTITSLRARQPECVLLALFQVEAALLFRQSREMNFRPTFMSGAGLFNPQVISLAREAANGLLLVSTYHPASDRAEVKSFVDLFKSKYSIVPSKFSAHAFDAVSLIANAVKTAGSPNTTRIRDALAATKDFAGVTGVISIDPDREIILALQRVMVKNEEFVPWVKS
ncbi:Branched-chain amino acid transport system substrate-binding protein [Hyphomicrobiales bacterium]|nr:Branched-chain amino acid transport system substrate-binding protein [Hyphomicrobiales bacterium]CAH1695389.1 Branched-chain amino acid transport system substrate-binding protein [Hyphomicrobiales bacterium]